jgi:hypothetical protein
VHRAVDGVQVHLREHRRQLPAVLDVGRDRLVGEPVEMIGLPVPLEAGRKERVEGGPYRRERDAPDAVERGRAESPGLAQVLLGLLRRAAVAPHDPAHLAHVELRRERRAGRDDEEREEAVQRLRPLAHEVVEEAHDLARGLDRVQGRTGCDVADRRRLEVQ